MVKDDELACPSCNLLAKVSAWKANGGCCPSVQIGCAYRTTPYIPVELSLAFTTPLVQAVQ